MSRNHDDEFVAVRVQDPRIHNEGSWNSFVDYKIFLHTNSKAFTAKTSCVRRRYSEFVWLKKKMQKNAGLVPVPDLPGKSFFSFTNEDFLERRRKGLQVFLDRVLHMTVCLSDSQLHLFLQTQLPVGHIEDCVRGHTPYTVTEAILTYASSNWGLAQAQTQVQEEDSTKEPSLTISYESMESPAPHQASQSEATLTSSEDTDPLGSLLDPVDFQRKRNSSVKVSQKNNHLEAVLECDTTSTEASFFLGDSPSTQGSVDPTDSSLSRSGQIQTPVEVHSPMEGGSQQDFGLELVRGESPGKEDGGEGNVTITQEENCTQVQQRDSSEEVQGEDPVVIVDSEDDDTGEQTGQIDPNSSQEVGFSQTPVLENHLTIEDHTDDTKVHDADVSHVEELDEEQHSEDQICDKTGSKEEAQGVEEDGAVLEISQNHADQGLDSSGTKNESDEDKHSLASSNGSIVKVSDEDSLCEEAEESVDSSPQNISHWSDAEACNKNILDLKMNGCFVENEVISAQDDEDFTSTEPGGDCSENSDFSILESSCTSGRTAAKRAEEQTLSVLSLDTTEESHEVEVC